MDPIIPDDMERIINTIRVMSGIQVDWGMSVHVTSKSMEYEIVFLGYAGSSIATAEKNNDLEHVVGEWLDWLEPVLKKCQEHVKKADIKFVPFQG